MLSLVVPVYRNEESIPDLLAAIAELDAKTSDGLEAVFVVDGSPDRSFERLREALPTQPYVSRVLLLSRNFGAFAAIRAGLAGGRGDRFAMMAADLQEPIELILGLDAEIASDRADVAIAVRAARNDPLLTRMTARIFWGLYRRFVVKDMPPGGVDLFACNRAFRDQLLLLEERHSSLIAQAFWLGFRRAYVPYVRQERRHGRSAWTLNRKLDYVFDSVFAFTDLPIRILVRVGLAFAAIAGAYGLFVATMTLLGFIQVPGFTALVVLTVFIGATNLFGLGIVGTYAWRAYENTKARPNHVVLREIEFPGSGEPGDDRD